MASTKIPIDRRTYRFRFALLVSSALRRCGMPIHRLLLLIVFAVALPNSPVKAETLDESALKAAFLNYFSQLISWPIASSTRELKFCSAGKSKLISLFEQLWRLQEPKKVTLIFSVIASPKEAQHCDYVFVESHNRAMALPIIATTRGLPVLTVSDADGFAKAGGVIELVRNENRVGVVINIDALASQDLRASSKLLSIAERIPSEGGPNE
ncbi:MAG: YfiR family protein [Halioglobus sp.]